MIDPSRLPSTASAIAALRWTMVVIFLIFGIMKFAAYEAEGVSTLAKDYWLFGWMYPSLGVQGVSNVIGTIELIIALLLALGARWDMAGLAGGVMGVVTFLITCSFMLIFPIAQEGHSLPYLGSAGQFLVKDIVLLAVCYTLALDAAHRLAAQRSVSR